MYNMSCNLYKSTIVTFYFNLKNMRDATPSVRPQEFYMEKGRATLKLAYPMVIFCDEKTYGFIKEIRDQEVSDKTLTKYVVKNLIDYECKRLKAALAQIEQDPFTPDSCHVLTKASSYDPELLISN